MRPSAFEPRRAGISFFTLSPDVFEKFPERGIAEGALELIARDGLKNDPGVAGQAPQFRFEVFPQLIGSVVPCPAEVERNPVQDGDIGFHFEARV
jgi:hypothetical protein